MKPLLVVNVVGLSPGLLGENTPFLNDFAKRGKMLPVRPEVPAVTCTAQSTYLTGLRPSEHGIVGNGWYFRDLAEVKFWRQPNILVQGEKVWETARKHRPGLRAANYFWWYNMYSSVDVSATPRPMYPADGRKLPDIYTHPPELRGELEAQLGDFPLFKFWGPRTDISSSHWIARAAMARAEQDRADLTLVYLPHLDYNLQRRSHDDPVIASDLREIDDVCRDLITNYQERGAEVVVLSEYGITPVSRPVHLNRAFREAGLLAVRDELGLEVFDPGASRAFAVADHQLAHVYVRDPGDLKRVREILEKTAGVERVFDDVGKKEAGLNHERSGELVVVAERDAWFTYYYWLDDARAPDFARTVDIHRKPGYDPVELFIDPKLSFPILKAAWILAKKKLGFRYLMDVIPLDAELVRGSHGRLPDAPEEGPLFIAGREDMVTGNEIAATSVRDILLRYLLDG